MREKMGIEVIADSNILQSLRELLQNKGYIVTIAENDATKNKIQLENVVDVIHFVCQQDANRYQFVLISCF